MEPFFPFFGGFGDGGGDGNKTMKRSEDGRTRFGVGFHDPPCRPFLLLCECSFVACF